MTNTPKLAIAIGYIDDDLVSGAVEYMPASSKKFTHLWKHFVAVAACIVLVFGSCLILTNNEIPPASETPPVSDAPAHFYYRGSLYSFSGEIVFSLPEDFELVSEIKNVGDSFSGVDFEGNVDGYVYMSESNNSIAYFQWKNWDEAVDGKEPYLTLIKTE